MAGGGAPRGWARNLGGPPCRYLLRGPIRICVLRGASGVFQMPAWEILNTERGCRAAVGNPFVDGLTLQIARNGYRKKDHVVPKAAMAVVVSLIVPAMTTQDMPHFSLFSEQF